MKRSRDLTFITSSKSHVDLRLGPSFTKSAPCLVWGSCIFRSWRYVTSKTTLSHDLKDYSIQVSCKFMGGKSSWYVTTLTILVTIAILIFKRITTKREKKFQPQNVHFEKNHPKVKSTYFFTLPLPSVILLLK